MAFEGLWHMVLDGPASPFIAELCPTALHPYKNRFSQLLLTKGVIRYNLQWRIEAEEVWKLPPSSAGRIL